MTPGGGMTPGGPGFGEFIGDQLFDEVGQSLACVRREVKWMRNGPSRKRKSKDKKVKGSGAA